MLNAVKQTGCRVIISGNRVMFSKIPSWSVYRYIYCHRDQLMLIALTEKLFKTHKPPKRVPYKTPLNKCPHCRHYNRDNCPYQTNGHKIPAGTFKKGCERWEESQAIYF